MERVYKITQNDSGWLIEEFYGENIYPPTFKKTAFDTARRFLQLIEVSEAKAQDWPEEHAIENVEMNDPQKCGCGHSLERHSGEGEGTTIVMCSSVGLFCLDCSAETP